MAAIVEPVCPVGFIFDRATCSCKKDGSPPPPPPPGCPDGQCKDSATGQCRAIGANEIKDAFGMCAPKPVLICPDGQCKDVTTGLCRPIGVGEAIGSSGQCITIGPPTGDVLWDSNIHLKTGQAFKVTGTYGSQEPDGKGVFMAASGSPRLIVDADGTFHLEADAGHGRVYIKARNYNAMMEGELMFEDDVIRNTTLRLRSRHNRVVPVKIGLVDLVLR